jgi:holo-[acyl-carrier protein] synthase
LQIHTGIDIVYIPRIKAILEKEDKNFKNSKFLNRVFKAHEISHILKRSNPIPGIAGRFAAKEACIKAMSKIKKIVNFKEIEVSGEIPDAKIIDFPKLKISVSISHDEDYAISIVNILDNV